MNLVVHNTLTGDRRSIELEAAEILIGRPDEAGPAPGIPLGSPMVSRRQALLRREDTGLTIEHLGFNETRLGDLVMEPGKRYRLEPGAEVRVAEFVLGLLEDAVAESASADDERIAELMRFESEIHDRLLARMDLRRGDTADGDDETRERVGEVLDELLEHAIGNASPELLDHILTTDVHRRLTWKITASGSERAAGQRQSGHSEQVYEQLLSDILGRIARTIDLSFDPKRMQDDAAALDAAFEKVFWDHRLEFSEGVQKYAVHTAVKQDLLDVIFGLGPLQDLMEMESISEVMVVAKDQVFIEKFGVIEDARREFFSDELLMRVLERIVAPIGRRIDRSSPLVDAHLPDGSRVNAVIPPLAVKGPCITIRKFSAQPLTIEDLVGFGALSEPMRRFLRACVSVRQNIVVSGGTGSGKTTFLNGLSGFVSPRERIVTIEDTAELQLKQAHVVTLESRPPNMEGKGAITIRDLVRNALRMRPDRIVVGECRGAEALDMLQAMNTGHDGSMTTAHANNPVDLVHRLETMVLQGAAMPISAIRSQISAAVDLVVQLTRFPDGTRSVTHVSEVVGLDPEDGSVVLEDVFTYQLPGGGVYAGGRHLHTGYIPSFVEQLLEEGAVELQDFF